MTDLLTAYLCDSLDDSQIDWTSADAARAIADLAAATATASFPCCDQDQRVMPFISAGFDLGSA